MHAYAGYVTIWFGRRWRNWASSSGVKRTESLLSQPLFAGNQRHHYNYSGTQYPAQALDRKSFDKLSAYRFNKPKSWMVCMSKLAKLSQPECRICRKLIVIYVVCLGRRIWLILSVCLSVCLSVSLSLSLSLSLWQSLLQVHYIFPLNIISENNKSDWRLSVRLVTILNMWSYRFWRSKYKIFFPGKKYWPDIAVSMRTSPPNKTETAIILIESPRTKQNGWNTASCWKKYANVSLNSGDCLLSEMIINRYAKMCKFARGGGGLNWNGMTGYELNN